MARRFTLVALLLASCQREAPPPPVITATPAPSVCSQQTDLAPIATDASSSQLALAKLAGERVAFLSDEDDAVLRVIDLERGSVRSGLAFAAPPGHVIVAPNGRVHVTVPELDIVVELAVDKDGTMKECSRKSTPPEPIALALGGETLLVASRRGRALSLFHPKSAPRTIALSRDPEGVLVAGNEAFVAHRVGSIVSVVALDQRVVAREVSFVWRDRIALGAVVVGDMPRFAVQAHGLARVRDRVVVPMVLAYPGDTRHEVSFTTGYGPTSVRGVDGYFPHEPAIASIGADGSRLHLRREVVAPGKQRTSTGRVASEKPCLLPRSIAVDGATTVVACMGIDRLLVLHELAEQALITVPPGPIAVAIDPSVHEVIAWSQFARALTFSSLTNKAVTRTIAIAADRAPDPIWADGRKAFHAPIAFDGRACASCHPDGLDDGLVWNSPIGMMQAPVLAGRVEGTAPYGWLGSAPTFEAHLASTMTRLQAKPMSDETMRSLAVYVRALRTRAKRALDPIEKRGRELFVSSDVGCAGCHSEDGRGADGLPHDVGTGAAFDTPSLASIATSAPYMHDGRFATLRETIVKTDGLMGTTKRLSEQDLDALIAYLKTL